MVKEIFFYNFEFNDLCLFDIDVTDILTKFSKFYSSTIIKINFHVYNILFIIIAVNIKTKIYFKIRYSIYYNIQ